MRELNPEEKHQKALKRSLHASQTNAAFTSIMESATTPFLTPFALFLGASNLVIGLLASLPGLIASFFQILAARVEHLVHSRRKIITMGTLLQAILWLPIMLVPFVEPTWLRPWILLLLVTLVTIIGQLIMPSWKSWLGDIIPEDKRGKYFSERNRIVGICSFVTVMIAGFCLDYFRVRKPIVSFMILIGAAVISRILSITSLSQIYDPKSVTLEKKPTLLETIESQKEIREHRQGFFQFLKNIAKDQFGKFVLFMFLFKAANSIASPFFAVYMLKVLNIGYWQFTILIAAELLASLIFMKFWGRFDDEQGSKRVVFITAILICLKPFLWLLGSNFYYLLFLHVFSGIIYAGFNIASETFVYDATDSSDRTTKTAYLALLMGVGVFLGATFGGQLLGVTIPNIPIVNIAIVSIPLLFIISGVVRTCIVIIMLPKLREMRLVQIDFNTSILHAPLFIKAHGGYEYNAVTTHDIKHATRFSSRKKNMLHADEEYWKTQKENSQRTNTDKSSFTSKSNTNTLYYSDGSATNHTKSHLSRNDPEVREFLRRMLKK